MALTLLKKTQLLSEFVNNQAIFICDAYYNTYRMGVYHFKSSAGVPGMLFIETGPDEVMGYSGDDAEIEAWIKLIKEPIDNVYQAKKQDTSE